MCMLVCSSSPHFGKNETLSNAYIVVATFWPPFDEGAKAAALKTLTYDTSGALRELAPDTGSYLNEVCPRILTLFL